MSFFRGTSWSPPDQEFQVAKSGLQWVDTQNLPADFYVGELPNPNLFGDTAFWYPATRSEERRVGKECRL